MHQMSRETVYLKGTEVLNEAVDACLAPAGLHSIHALRWYLEALVLRCFDTPSQKQLTWG